MTKVIEVENLTCMDKRRGKKILDNVTFYVDKGDFVAVVGPNGGGKSTLLKILSGGSAYLRDVEIHGKVIVDNINVLKARSLDLAGVVGIVLQNPLNQIVTGSVEEEIAFPLENLLIPSDEIAKRVEEVLKLMGIEHLRNRATHELSVGEIQRVCLATVLAIGVKILLLDEPLAYLDPPTKKAFVEHLAEINRRYGTTIVMVEHDLDYIFPYVNKILVLDRRIIAYGAPEDIVVNVNLVEYGVKEPIVATLAKSFGCRPSRNSFEVLKCIRSKLCMETNPRSRWLTEC